MSESHAQGGAGSGVQPGCALFPLPAWTFQRLSGLQVALPLSLPGITRTTVLDLGCCSSCRSGAFSEGQGASSREGEGKGANLDPLAPATAAASAAHAGGGGSGSSSSVPNLPSLHWHTVAGHKVFPLLPGYR